MTTHTTNPTLFTGTQAKFLRGYQSSVKKEVYDVWRVDDLCFLVMGTGLGKTVTFIDVIHDVLSKNKRVMLIAHREELIAQAEKTAIGNRIMPGIIMGSLKTNYALPCQVCSIQTIARRKDLPAADVIIIDEGHHVTDANSYGKILLRYPNAKVLIVSATPYRLSGEGFENLMPGKKTRLVLGPDFRYGINEGWLCPFKYFASTIPDTSNVHTGNNGEVIDEEAYEAMKLVPLVDSYLRDAAGLQGVVFCQNVKHSIDTCGQYWRHGVPSAHLDSNTPDEPYRDATGAMQPGRKQIMSDFTSGLIKVVTNVGIITEGTDFPNCRFVQLAMLTESLSKFLQAIGRGGRPLPGIVDGLPTAEARKAAIAASAKPDFIILDNSGLWTKHMLPDHPHDWGAYFRGIGKRKKKEVDDMEMLVYIAEDATGKQFRTNRVEEVEGMKLVEVTKEMVRKVINLKALKEFDKQYNMFKNMATVKKPGYIAFNGYFEFCTKNKILMVPAIWDYLHAKLIDDNQRRLNDMEAARQQDPTIYPQDMYDKAVNNIKRSMVSRSYFSDKRREYLAENSAQIIEYETNKK